VAVPPTRRDLPVRGGHGDVRGRPRRPPRMSPWTRSGSVFRPCPAAVCSGAVPALA